MEEKIKRKQGFVSISPMLVFLAVYTSSSIIAGDFYAASIIVSFLIASIYSIFIVKEKSIESRFAVLAREPQKRTS